MRFARIERLEGKDEENAEILPVDPARQQQQKLPLSYSWIGGGDE